MATKVLELEGVFQDLTAAGLEGLAARVRDTATSAQQATVHYAALNQALGGVQSVAATATTSTGSLAQSLRGLSQEGLQQVAGQVPVVGSALGRLGGAMLALAGPVGIVVGLGLAVVESLKGLQREATATVAAVTNLSTGIAAKFQAAREDVAQIEAQAAFDKTGAAEAAARKAIILAEQERDARIRTAEAERDAVLNATFTTEAGRQQAVAKFTALRADAEADAANKILVADKTLEAQRKTIDRERAQFVQDLSNQGVAAALERAHAEAEASGNVLATAQVELQQKLQAIEQEKQARLRAIQEAGLPAAEAALARIRADQIATQQIAAAETGLLQRRRDAAATSLQLAQDTAAKRAALDKQVADSGAAAEQAASQAKSQALDSLGGHAREIAERRLQDDRAAAQKSVDDAAKAWAKQIADAQNALDREIAAHGQAGEQVAKLRQDLADLQKAAADDVANKEREAASKSTQAWQTFQSTISTLAQQGVELIAKLGTASQAELGSARFAGAAKQAADLREQLHEAAEAFPQLAAAAQAGLGKLDEAMGLVASGNAKSLDDAIAQVGQTATDAAQTVVGATDTMAAGFAKVAEAAGTATTAASGIGSGTLKATGSPFGGGGGSIQAGTQLGATFDLPFLFQHRNETFMDLGGGFGINPAELFRQAIESMRAQQKAQDELQNFLKGALGQENKAAGVTVNMNGTTLVDSDRRMYDLAGRIGANVADRRRRGI